VPWASCLNPTSLSHPAGWLRSIQTRSAPTYSTPVRVESADDGGLRLAVRTEDGERQLEGSHLLSATGRVPNTDTLTPEAAGIRLDDRGFIEVDEYLETSVPGVYAMGT
jgi:pyruvate/2-oxoglutarate dehydrogenase complex dihydrolipoamide dehydrogenase (E3) component